MVKERDFIDNEIMEDSKRKTNQAKEEAKQKTIQTKEKEKRQTLKFKKDLNNKSRKSRKFLPSIIPTKKILGSPTMKLPNYSANKFISNLADQQGALVRPVPNYYINGWFKDDWIKEKDKMTSWVGR